MLLASCSKRLRRCNKFKQLDNIDTSKLPYFIKRSSSGSLPVYTESLNFGLQIQTVVNHIHGDMQAFESDLKTIVCQGRLSIQNKGVRKLVLSGDYSVEIRGWLHSLGF